MAGDFPNECVVGYGRDIAPLNRAGYSFVVLCKQKNNTLCHFSSNVQSRSMTSENQSHSYGQLKENILLLATKQDRTRKWNIFALILSLTLGAEVITSTFLLYGLSREINQVKYCL